MAHPAKTLLSSDSYNQTSEEDIDHRINKFSTQDASIILKYIDTIRATRSVSNTQIRSDLDSLIRWQVINWGRGIPGMVSEDPNCQDLNPPFGWTGKDRRKKQSDHKQEHLKE